MHHASTDDDAQPKIYKIRYAHQTIRSHCSVRNLPFRDSVDEYQLMYDRAMDEAFHVQFCFERAVGRPDAAKTGGLSVFYESESAAREAFAVIQSMTRRHHGLKIEAPQHFCLSHSFTAN